MNVLTFFTKNKQSTANLPAPGDAPTPHVSSITYPGGGWEPLGYNLDGSYVVLSRKTGQPVTLRAQDLNEKKLLVSLGQGARNACMVYDPDLEQEVFDPAALSNSIGESCDSMGLFDQARVRGPGLYSEGDDLVINFGEEVATASGNPVDTAPTKLGPVYQSGPSLGFELSTPCASESDVQLVTTAIRSFSLARSSDFIYLLGWLVMAILGQVLNHRPILAITAERGSGKTTLIELFSRLLGPQAMRRDGIPTLPQVIYELTQKSAALLVDEVEARGAKRSAAIEHFLDSLNIFFTNSSARRMSRVHGGKLQYFGVPCGVLLAGIGLPALGSATDSRAVRVCMDPLSAESSQRYEPLFDPARENDTVALGARLRRLVVTRYPVLRETQALLRPMLIALGHEARAADKFSTLISGYVALTKSTASSAEELRQLIELLELSTPERVVTERDAEVCQRVLLGRKVAIFTMRGGERAKSHEPIREVISRVIHGKTEDRTALTMQLEQFGVRPLWVKDAKCWKIAVCTSEQHEGMRRLMQHTDWARGGWKDVLSRLPGAQTGVQRVAKVSQRVVMFDMPSDLLAAPADEVYDFPEPEPATQVVRAEVVE